MATDHEHTQYCGPDAGPRGCPGPVTYDELKARPAETDRVRLGWTRAVQKPAIEDKVTEMTPHEAGCTVADPCSECRPAVAILPVDLLRPEDRPRSLRQILWTHRALAGAGADDITDLMREIQRGAGVQTPSLDQLLILAVAELKQMRDLDVRIPPRWDDRWPSLADLIRLVDGE